MVDKVIAQRDVEYLHELLSKETDENRRTILLRLLAEAEKNFSRPKKRLRVRIPRATIKYRQRRRDETALPAFQLPTFFAPMIAPNSMSVRRDSPRHMTMLPGGGSLVRAR